MCSAESLTHPNPTPMKEQIFDGYAVQIAELFNLKVEDLFVKSKKRDVVDARQLLYYACSKRPMRVV